VSLNVGWVELTAVLRWGPPRQECFVLFVEFRLASSVDHMKRGKGGFCGSGVKQSTAKLGGSCPTPDS